MAQEHLHHFAHETVLILGGACGTLAGPSRDQVGAVNSDRRTLLDRCAIAAALQQPLVAAQLSIFPNVVEEQVNRRKGHRARRELIAWRGKANAHLLSKRRRQLSL